MRTEIPTGPLALTLKVIEGGDDDHGRPFVRFSSGGGDSVLYLENRAQVGWFMRLFDREVRFEVLAALERVVEPEAKDVPSERATETCVWCKHSEPHTLRDGTDATKRRGCSALGCDCDAYESRISR